MNQNNRFETKSDNEIDNLINTTYLRKQSMFYLFGIFWIKFLVI